MAMQSSADSVRGSALIGPAPRDTRPYPLRCAADSTTQQPLHVATVEYRGRPLHSRGQNISKVQGPAPPEARQLGPGLISRFNCDIQSVKTRQKSRDAGDFG
jgi:hypothetical protein